MSFWEAADWSNIDAIENALGWFELGRPSMLEQDNPEKIQTMSEIVDSFNAVGKFDPVPPKPDSELYERLVVIQKRFVECFRGVPGTEHIPALRKEQSGEYSRTTKTSRNIE